MKQLICAAGSTLYFLDLAMLLVICKCLKLEAGYSPTKYEAIMLFCIKQTTIIWPVVLCVIVSTSP